MKKVITLIILFLTVTAYGQGVRTLEIKNVEKKTPVDSDTKLMVWDSLDFGKAKYTRIGDLPIGNDGVVQSVSLLGNLLNFSGTNGAFSGAVDLGSLAGGSDNLGNHTATQNLLMGEFWVDLNDTSDGTFPNRSVLSPSGLVFQSNINASSEQPLIRYARNSFGGTVMRLSAITTASGLDYLYFGENSTNQILKIKDDEVELPNTNIADVYGSAKRVVTYEALQDYVTNNVVVNSTLQDILDNGSTVDATNINSINNSSLFFWQSAIASDNFSFINYNGVGVSDTANSNGVVLNSDLIRYDHNGSSVSVKADNITSSWNHQIPNNNGIYTVGLSDGTTTALAGANGIIDASGLDFGGSGSSTAAETTYNNSGSSLTSTDVKAALDELDAKIPSSQLPYVTVNDSTYTMLEADILASKSYLIKAYRVDGITPVDTVTVTYPTINHDNSLLVNSFANISGSSIKVIPDTNVLDYRSGTKKQYTTKPELQGYVSISSVAQDSIWGSSQDWTISDYTPPAVIDNLILNSENDDSLDVSYSGDFAITGGEIVYTHTAGSATFTWDLSEDMAAGASYTFTMDITNLISGNARFRIFVNQGGSFVEVVGNTNYNTGVDVTFNAPAGVDSTQLQIITSSAASSFNGDNSVLIAN